MLVPTTRRGVSFLRQLLTPGQMRGVNIRKLGETRANTNLSEAYLRDVIAELEGDDWGAEELRDEDRDEAPGALWKRVWILHAPAAPELVRVVVAVDPADDGKENSDETGIVVVGLGLDGRLYVLADYTARWRAEHWAAICAWAFRYYEADAIVGETQRAEPVRRCSIEAPGVPIVGVNATKGKLPGHSRSRSSTRMARSPTCGRAAACRPGHVWTRSRCSIP
jgi:phage terminase large subunit-like protein